MSPQNLLPRHPWQMSPHRASSSPMHLRQGHGSGQASHRAVPSPGELLPLRVLLGVLLATTQIPPGTSGAFGAYRIVTFPIPPPHGKVTILYALYAQNPLTGTKGTKF